jgi:hypothetical protein
MIVFFNVNEKTSPEAAVSAPKRAVKRNDDSFGKCGVTASLRLREQLGDERRPEKNVLFLSFSYVCPEPVLVKCSFLYINGAKSTIFSPLQDACEGGVCVDVIVDAGGVLVRTLCGKNKTDVSL